MNNDIKFSIKYIFNVVKKERPFLFLIYFGLFLIKVIAIFQQVILPKYILDELVFILKKTDIQFHQQNVIIFVLLLLASNLLSNILSSIFNSKLNLAKEYFSEYIDVEFAEKTLSIKYSTIESSSFLDYKNQAYDGLNWYSGGILGILDVFFGIITNSIICIFLATLIIAKAPLLLLLQIISIIFSIIFKSKALQIFHSYFVDLSKINRLFGYYLFQTSSIENGKDIRIYNFSDLIISKAKKYANKHVKQLHQRDKRKSQYEFLVVLLETIKDFFAYSIILIKVIKKLFSVGDISMLITAFQDFYQNTMDVVYSLQEIKSKCFYFNKYIEYLKFDNEIKKGKLEKNPLKYDIEFKNVSFKYPNTNAYVLKNINLKISSGEKLSIVGFNGAGKTTLIKLLCRLYDLEEGEILLNGININEYSDEFYKNFLSVVFQDSQLFAFSIKENICFDKNCTDEILASILEKTAFDKNVLSLNNGSDTYISKFFAEDGIELSGGMEQKLLICRAIFKNSPVVILDEPTAALDPLAESEIYENFQTLMGEKTTIFISHRLSSCLFCDKIAVFSEGKIVEYGTHEELIKRTNGIYSRMFEEQGKLYGN